VFLFIIEELVIQKEIRIYDVDFLLLPEKAMCWKEKGMLVVADVHLGKSAAFRAMGIPLPPGTTSGNLERLSKLVAETGASKLLIIGDLFHQKEYKNRGTFERILDWREGNRSLEILLVSGNHDKRAGNIPAELGIVDCGERYEVDNFVFTHEPAEVGEKYVFSGHLHPAVQLKGKGREFLKLPCFCFGKKSALLPAFGEFTGTHVIRPDKDCRVFIPANGEVIEIRNAE
jgi:uncharacterized protein